MAFRVAYDVTEPVKRCINSVSWNWIQPDLYDCFATAGGSLAVVYRNGEIIQVYQDPDPDEDFYTVCWACVDDTPLLIVAGIQAVIKIINVSTGELWGSLVGHGAAIDQVSIRSPDHPGILVTASKDKSIRVWSLKYSVCICILAGHLGHRDEVLSARFLENGNIVSGGMDHAVKIWKLPPRVMELVDDYSIDPRTRGSKQLLASVTQLEQMPVFTTHSVHDNYVDHVDSFGDLIVSKSIPDLIHFWSPVPGRKTTFNALTLDYANCNLWFVRFGMDYRKRSIAIGNLQGKVYIWDLTTPDKTPKPQIISLPRSKALTRQCAFSFDGNSLACVTDATITYVLHRKK